MCNFVKTVKLLAGSTGTNLSVFISAHDVI